MNTEDRKKVRFSLTKYTKKGSFRFCGYGEIDNENLYTKDKVYEDCIPYCHKVLNTTEEFKGCFNLFEEIEFTNDRNQTINLEVENDYYLWFRILN